MNVNIPPRNSNTSCARTRPLVNVTARPGGVRQRRILVRRSRLRSIEELMLRRSKERRSVRRNDRRE